VLNAVNIFGVGLHGTVRGSRCRVLRRDVCQCADDEYREETISYFHNLTRKSVVSCLLRPPQEFRPFIVTTITGWMLVESIRQFKRCMQLHEAKAHN
jgi:hypothetical protein